jgi:hypothetical protein
LKSATAPTLSVFNWILLLTAAYSLVTILVLFRIDTVVNETLYSYGLQFSSDWATLYWTTIRIGFAVSWLVIITAIALQIYFTRKTKETVEEQKETVHNKEEPWCTYTLSDGSTIKVKHKLKSAKRLEKYTSEGIPIYAVDYDNIVQVVSVPEKLARSTKSSA